MKYLKYFLICVPLSIAGHYLHWNDTIMFILCCLAIVPLAGYLGEATEELAAYTGPKIGGFLNATFGNTTELIIAFFAMKEGLVNVVKASLAGSILSNILLVLGLSIFVGGLKHKELKFDADQGSFTSTMLLFTFIGLAIPAAFSYMMTNEVAVGNFKWASVITAVILLVIYVLGLLYSFKTQNDLYGLEHAEDIDSKWDKKTAIFIIGLTTVFIAVISELLVKSIEPMAAANHINSLFVGLILIPIVGNAAEHSTAIIMALKNKMDISIEIAAGSCLQIALFVTPLMVLVSLFFVPMNIIFMPIELVIFGASVMIVNRIVSSGRSNYMEGLMLVSIYLIAAVGFLLM